MPTDVITIGQQTQTIADQMFDAVFEHSGHCLIEMSFDEACQFIRRIEEYNEFQADYVLTALENIDRLIPRKYYGEGNPNNGQRSYSISVGREGSPVIYLERYEWDKEDGLTEETITAICREMELIGRADDAGLRNRGHCPPVHLRRSPSASGGIDGQP